MNFVREIVESNAMVTLEKLTNELPQVLEDSISLKSKSLHQIETVYVKFLSRPRTFQFLEQTQQLMTKAQQLEANIDEVIKVEVAETQGQIVQCKQQLQQVTTILDLCYEFSNIYSQLQQLSTHIDLGRYVEAAEILEDFKRIDTTKEHNDLRRKLHMQAAKQGHHLTVKVEGVLNKYIEYSTRENDDILMHLIAIQPKSDKVEQAFKAISFFGMRRMHFIKKWKQMIIDVISSIVQHASLVRVADKCVIEVKKMQKDSYKTIFENLSMFANYLKNYMDFSLDEHTSILDCLRCNFQEELTELIIKYCLEATIPDSESELELYSEVEKETNLLENTLKEAQLLDAGCSALSDYTSEVQVHFVNKKAKKYNAMATTLMKQDLHVIVMVGVPFNPNDLSLTGFPECAISKSTVDLLALAQSLIQKEISCSGGSSGYYVETARSILAQYDAAIEEYHQRLLQTVPRQRAIFYNNCKYIAHELKTITWVKLMSQLPAVFQEYTGFTQVAFQLNECALHMLEKLTSDQVEMITQRIDESGIHLACDKLDEKVAQAVRQCLRQQELIKTMWQKVLNYHDYNRTIGMLLDVLSRCMTENIKKISDIPLDVCEQLVDVLKLIVTRGPKLLTDPKEIHMYVTHWGKLNEMMFVLNSCLEAIGERWADGKGPLALHFTPNEMRTLIRALFQNSDKRAALLVHI